MVTKITAGFAELIRLANASFQQVEITTDSTPQRAILRIQAIYGPYRITVTELFSDGVRKYCYYVLRGDWVEAGFDNNPDPRALRLKYGHIGETHHGEPIPHLHLQDKTVLQLTDEMQFADFVEWVQNHLSGSHAPHHCH
ncbi:MAG: hypothetical protein GY862_07630 [Gammaproteobacteria bacterium]|nr:hypothetical protein [Gammaproteobacteria bacterium]